MKELIEREVKERLQDIKDKYEVGSEEREYYFNMLLRDINESIEETTEHINSLKATINHRETNLKTIRHEINKSLSSLAIEKDRLDSQTYKLELVNDLGKDIKTASNKASAQKRLKEIEEEADKLKKEFEL